MQTTMNMPRTRQGVRNLDEVKGTFLPISAGPAPSPATSVNVGSNERMLSTLAGSALTTFGLSRATPVGLCLAALGGSLLFRGLKGHCYLFDALHMNTADKVSSNAELVYGSQR